MSGATATVGATDPADTGDFAPSWLWPVSWVVCRAEEGGSSGNVGRGGRDIAGSAVAGACAGAASRRVGLEGLGASASAPRGGRGIDSGSLPGGGEVMVTVLAAGPDGDSRLMGVGFTPVEPPAGSEAWKAGLDDAGTVFGSIVARVFPAVLGGSEPVPAGATGAGASWVAGSLAGTGWALCSRSAVSACAGFMSLAWVSSAGVRGGSGEGRLCWSGAAVASSLASLAVGAAGAAVASSLVSLAAGTAGVVAASSLVSLAVGAAAWAAAPSVGCGPGPTEFAGSWAGRLSVVRTGVWRAARPDGG